MQASQTLQVFPADESLQPLIRQLAVGLDTGLEEQLIQKSRQPNILQFTPKDAGERFGDAAMFEKWRAKGREIHWLLGDADDLAGIIWYGAAAFPLDIDLPETPTETFAVRIYDGYAGKGLARPFLRQSLRVHVQLKQAAGEKIAGLWLETGVDNPAACAVYSKFGFHEVFRDEKRATMILSATEIAEFA